MVAGGRVNCNGMLEKEKVKTEKLVISRFLRALGHGSSLEIFSPIIDHHQSRFGTLED